MIGKIARFLFLAIISLQVLGGIMLINQSDLLFSHTFNAYGPLKNNLLFVVVYITIAEVLLIMSRFLRNGSHEVFLMGTVLVLTIIGMEFYATVNAINLNGDVMVLGLFFGMCHFAYGIFLTKGGQHKLIR